MDNKKILIINNGLAGGGIERASVSLANYFSEIGYQVSILALYQSKHFFKLHSSIKFIEPKFKRTKFNKYFYVLKMMDFIRKNANQLKPDTILAFGEWTNPFVILALLFIMNRWGIEIGPLLASLGIAGIAIGFAVKDSLANIFGGIQLIVDKTFKVGDKVELSDGTVGVIQDISLRSTRIRTYDNELIIIPNGKMANEAIKQTKAYDSKIKLITDEDVWTNHYWYLAGNLDKRLDGFAIHPYTFHGHTPGPEKAHFGQGTEGWMKGWTIIDGDRSMRSLMRRLRAEYLEKIGRPMEMYITEWGHPVGGKGYKKGEKMTEDDIAAYLPRAYMSGVAAGARVVCWHVSQDMGDGPMGLIRNDQTKRKSYYALKTMVEQLGEYRMIKQLSGMENTTKGVQAYLFEGDAGYKLVAWNIDGPVEVFFESASSAPLRVYNNFDKPVGFRFAKDGPPILSLGKAPIYIEGIGKDCSLKLVPKLVDDSEEKAADKAKTKARPRGNETNVLAWLKKYNSEKYLKGYKLVKQIAGVKNPNKGIQGYLFEGDAGYKLVAWTTGKTVKVLFEPGYTLRPRVSNHLGKGVNFGYAKDGPPILKLNKAPIFIEGIGKECSLELMEQIK